MFVTCRKVAGATWDVLMADGARSAVSSLARSRRDALFYSARGLFSKDRVRWPRASDLPLERAL